MVTTVLRFYTKGYPLITNRIRASVYLQSDPQALIAEIIDDTAGHPSRVWSFPGLPRENYGMSLDEIDNVNSVVNNIALFDVVPGEIEGYLVRDDEQITVAVTPGLSTGASSFVFDGAETSPGSGIFKPNYIGWDIVPSELTGRGIMKEFEDYYWLPESGTFQLLIIGDEFANGATYNIHFNSRQNGVVTSYPTLNDFQINFIDSSTAIDYTFFGKKLIIEPIADYMTVTLPDINTVVEGRPLMVEVSKTDLCCVKFLTTSGQEIDFLRGMIYALPGETFTIYKFIRPDLTKKWRVCNIDANFKQCGSIVSFDSIPVDTVNAHLLDGESVPVNKYARLYNEVVLNLPPSQVCNFADWATGENKYKYSYSNGTNFRIPDRRGLYERNTDTGNKAGDYLGMSVESHQHNSTENSGSVVDMRITVGGTSDLVGGTKFKTYTVPALKTGSYGGSETRPVTNLINKYVLL